MAMIAEQSETLGRDVQPAVLLRHKWQAEIERAVDKVKMEVVAGVCFAFLRDRGYCLLAIYAESNIIVRDGFLV
jgi:hypothetical protein